MESIMQSEKICYVCGKSGCHSHHIFEGTANRKKSEKYGLKVWLCPACHNLSDRSVHNNPNGAVDIYLKKQAQLAFESRYSHTEFMQEFGKNYL